MSTNDTVIVVRDDDVVYTGRCMRQDVKAYEVKQYGEERADNAAVYLPDMGADVAVGDYILFGDMPEDIHEAVRGGQKAVSVTRHDYGSENMRHIRIGVV